MCYGFYPVQGTEGGTDWVDRAEFFRLEREGKIVIRKDGFHYAKDTVGAVLFQDHRFQTRPFRWDLVPRDFLIGEPTLSLTQVLKKKNSRSKNPLTGKSWGFDSYNARVETIRSLASFKKPWQEGLRCVLPSHAFKERPNMDGAPPEFKGKEYKVQLDGTYYLGAVYDTWVRNAERLDSCSIITMSSRGNAKIEGIWHERIPLILTEQEALRWLDPKTTPEEALQLCRPLHEERMEIVEVEKKPADPRPESQQGNLFL